MNEPKMTNKRIWSLISVALIFAVVVALRLINLQVVNRDSYLQKSQSKIMRNMTILAPRGEILDRYGRPMVTNRRVFSVVVDKVLLGENDLNDLIWQLIDVFEQQGETYADTLPISGPPYSYTFDTTNPDGSDYKKIVALKKKLELTADASASEIMTALKQRYKIKEGIDEKTARKIISVRFEMENRQFTRSTPFTIAESVDIPTVTRILEHKDVFLGAEIIEGSVREYVDPNSASHILGYIGPIYKDEYEVLKEKGYRMNDTLGKDGIEKVFEQYLRGTNGKMVTQQSKDGGNMGVSGNIDPIPGNNVLLTIDKDLQKVAEKSLEENIKKIASRGREGYDASAGAVVVLDVNTGDTLACANYPTFNLSTYNKDYNTLYKNPDKPLINRALSGIYEPGSTFKMLTAVAGLEEGVISSATRITCRGIYEFFAPSYRPRCWVFSSGRTHGTLDIVGAIEKSCNIFFFETGRLLGIDKLNEYTRKFGLGEYTGIELQGESKGVIAGRENSEKRGDVWYNGNTVQAAIGQSDNLFTPIQIANYIATLVNGGKNYKVTLLSKVKDYTTGQTVLENEPIVKNTVNISDTTYNLVMRGMKKVTEDGTASSVFANYPVGVGGKTGSAEVSSGSANGIFVAFAPYDNPQIAVAIIVEHGAHGNSVAPIARDIFDEYFKEDTEDASIGTENTLQP